VVNRTRLKIYGVLAGTFLLGGAAGAGASYAFAQREYRHMVVEGREMFEHRRLAALARELELTPDQRERIREVMRKQRHERHKVMKAAMERCGAPLEQHKVKAESEIRAILNPEQKQRFDALIDEYGDGFMRRPPPHGPPPHGPPHPR
jgi:Spy/CpxP family protein refolding chaperone